MRDSLDLTEQLQTQWGLPHIHALAQLVSRVTRSVEVGAGANPFAKEAADVAWHRNAFTHREVCAAINALLDRYKPRGPVQVPETIKDRFEGQLGPGAMGQACACGVLSQISMMTRPPLNSPAGAHYAEGYHVFPDIRDVLGEPNK